MPHGISFAFEIENEDVEILKLSSEKHDFSPPLEKQEHPYSSSEYIISANWRPTSEIYAVGQDIEHTGFFPSVLDTSKLRSAVAHFMDPHVTCKNLHVVTAPVVTHGPRGQFPGTTVPVRNLS